MAQFLKKDGQAGGVATG